MNDTIAAISTTTGAGAISIIRVSGNEAIEISFSTADGTVELPDFIRLLPGYYIVHTPDNNRIVCKPYNGIIDQKAFLSAISSIDVKISSIKRTSQKDLEAIMMEVLAK